MYANDSDLCPIYHPTYTQASIVRSGISRYYGMYRSWYYIPVTVTVTLRLTGRLLVVHCMAVTVLVRHLES